MGRIVKVLSFIRTLRNDAKVSDAKVDTGGGANVTAEHYASAGDDAHPLPDDYAITNNVQQTGKEAVVGYLDIKNDQKAQPGDKRIYARDADTGVMIVEIWLKNDGTVTTSNDNGSFTLQVNGDVTINGVIIAANGDVTIPNSLILNGKELDGHDHSINTGSSAPGPTGPNN